MIEWGTKLNTIQSDQYWVWNPDASVIILTETPTLILPAVNQKRLINISIQKFIDTDPIYNIKLWLADLPPNSGMINFPDLSMKSGQNIINWELSAPLSMNANTTEVNKVFVKVRTATLSI